MDKRIVVTGANGMLGRLLVDHFTALGGCEVLPLTRKEMNLERDSTIRRALENFGMVDVIIHAAAMTDVDLCEEQPKKAEQINGYATGLIGSVATDMGAQVIYISTDYVFDGTKEEPYTEEDEPNPISTYGASKRTGEEELFDSFPDHLAVRVSWLFGPGKKCFPEWAVRRAMSEPDLQAVCDKWGSPTYAVDVVKHLEPFVFSDEPYGGVLHLANAGQCTWQEWAQHTLDCAAAAGIPLKAAQADPIKMEELAKRVNWKAPRPRFTPLSTAESTEVTGQTPRPWQEAIEEFVKDHLAVSLKA